MNDWDIYWNGLISEKNLKSRISDLNRFDEKNGFEENHTENICKGIYSDYTQRKEEFKKVEHSFLSIIRELKEAHSFSSRIKEVDSLIVKIINKRAEKYGKLEYRNLSVENYKSVFGDIIGMRIILHYQGQWRGIHNEIVNNFPEHSSYPISGFVPHEQGKQFMAEEPKAYYAYGDDISQFDGVIKVVPHEKGYRSIHYVISYMGVYIELQTRTIYDEAWSDCDHTYVYKQDANPNNLALSQLTTMLSKLTNCSSDISELMRLIYFGKIVTCHNNKIHIDQDGRKQIQKSLDNIHAVESELKIFFDKAEKD